VPLPAGESSYPRPLVKVQLAGMAEAPLTCLVDSGAKHNRFHGDFARAAGINLDDPDDEDIFYAGNRQYTGRIVRVQMSIASLAWEAPVCFIDDWGPEYQVLGHEGFFRWFRICFYAADEKLSVDLAER